MAKKSRYMAYVNRAMKREQAEKPASSIKERMAKMKRKAYRKKEV